MNIPQDIIANFRREVSKEACDPIQVEMMVQGLQDLLEETDPAKLATKSYELLRTHSQPAFGASVCQVLLSRPEDGIKLASDVGKQVTQSLVSKVPTNQLDTFLRNNSSISNFSREFVQQTSPGYVQSIQEKAKAIGEKANVLEVDKNGSAEEKRQTTLQMAKEMKAMLSSTDGMSIESQQYIKGLYDGVMSDPDFQGRVMHEREVDPEKARQMHEKLGNIAINNSAALRFGASSITLQPDFQSLAIWKDASNSAQKSFNLNDQDRIRFSGGRVSQEDLDTIHSQESREKVDNMMTSIKETTALEGTGIKMESVYNDLSDVREVVMEQRKEIATDLVEQRKQLAKQQQEKRDVDAKVAETVKPELDKIASLEAKLDRMKNNPTIGDKFKAFFQGGMEKAQQKVLAEIDKTKLQVFQKTDPEGFSKLQGQNKKSVETLKQDKGQFVGQKLDHLKASAKLKDLDADLIKDESLKESNLPGLSNEQRNKVLVDKEIALGDLRVSEQGAQIYDQHSDEIKALEKNVSVREKFGSKAEQKVEAPHQGMKLN